jgi:hypothetical protein
MPPCPHFVVHHLYKLNASRSLIALITIAQVQLVYNTLAICLVKINGMRTQARHGSQDTNHNVPRQPHARWSLFRY